MLGECRFLHGWQGKCDSYTTVTQVVVISYVCKVEVLDAANSYNVANKGECGDAWHKNINKDLGGIQSTRAQSLSVTQYTQGLENTTSVFYDGLHLTQKQRGSLGL